ncbi:MAG: flagellar export protein FliJ [Lachnospiraceae bacterium]|nr:flagellar export protein FliJ [Lachnospiraceae bacterium]
MAKFVFPLQNVLNVKAQMERLAKQDFSSARAALNKEEEKLKKIHERKAYYENRAKELLQGTLDVLEIEANKNAIITMENLSLEQKRNVEIAEDNLEKARKALEDVMIERKTYETLKERAFENFKREVNRQEQKEVDELTSYTYGQKRQV